MNLRDAHDLGPTDQNSFRYGVSCGLGAAAVMAERRGRHDLAAEIRAYEAATTKITYGGRSVRQMTHADIGLYAPGEMRPEDIGLDAAGKLAEPLPTVAQATVTAVESAGAASAQPELGSSGPSRTTNTPKPNPAEGKE